MKDIDEQIRLHSAGAIVRHNSSFTDLPSFRNDFELSKELIAIWVAPFYMVIGNTDDKFIKVFGEVKGKITKEIAITLLGDFNWRTRQTGAFFAAIKNYTDLIDIIGIHLLKSEVCYAGQVYACTLALFNTPKCAEYLNLYLNYYLTKPDLYFDQRQVLEAAAYLDKINGTNYLKQHLNNWTTFTLNKPYLEKDVDTKWIESQLAFIENIKQFGQL